MNVDERKKRLTKRFETIINDDSKLDDLEFVLDNLFTTKGSMLNEKQYVELEDTIQQVDAGEMKMISWEEAKRELKNHTRV